MSIPAILFGSFALLLLIRVPLGFALGIATVLTMAIDGLPLTSLAVTYFSAVDSFAFMAIPLFLFAGSLMEHGGISKRIIDVADIDLIVFVIVCQIPCYILPLFMRPLYRRLLA